MRLTIISAGIFLALALPATASAQECGCIQDWANAVQTNTNNARTSLNNAFKASGYDAKTRKRVRRGIKDKSKRDPNSSWCKAHSKTCAALIRCAYGAGVALVAEIGTPDTIETYYAKAAGGCLAGWGSIYLPTGKP